MIATYRKISFVALGYCIAVILWGAFVRATGSGAGCGAHWPLCNGDVLPHSPAVETLIELTHRVTSGLILVLVGFCFFYARRAFATGDPLRRASFLCLLFVCLEALIGAGIVLLELVADDASSLRAYWVGGHLVNTLFLVGVLTYNFWLCANRGRSFAFLRKENRSLLVAGFWVLLLGASGAIVALGDTLFPAESLAHGIQQDLDPNAHFMIKLRVWHPVLAIGFAIYAIILGNLKMRSTSTSVARAAKYFMIVVVSQILCGLLNLFLLAPVWIQMVHLLLGNLVWISLLWLLFEHSVSIARSDVNAKNLQPQMT